MTTQAKRAPALSTFVVEGFLPAATAASLREVTVRLERGLSGLGRPDPAARAIAATLIPADDAAYWVVVAASANAVSDACAAAGLQVERIVDALEIRAGRGTHAMARERRQTSRRTTP